MNINIVDNLFVVLCDLITFKIAMQNSEIVGESGNELGWSGGGEVRSTEIIIAFSTRLSVYTRNFNRSCHSKACMDILAWLKIKNIPQSLMRLAVLDSNRKVFLL